MSKIKKLQNPHDKTFRASLSNIEVAKDFLNTYLPKKILENIDLNNIVFCPNSYIEENLKEQLSDIVYYSKSNDSNHYIYTLIEHQSSAIPLMPLRIVKYQIAIMEQHLQQHPKEQLPVVYVLLFYNGTQKPYPYSLNLYDLFSNSKLAEQTFAKPAQLIDVTQMTDEEIKQHNIISLLEFGQKHIRDRDWLLIIKDFKELVIKLCNHPSFNENLLAYLKCNLYYIMELGSVEKVEEFRRELEEIPIIKEKIMNTLARKFKDEGRVEGESKGKKEVATSMLSKKMSLRLIKEVTGLAIEEIQKLKPKKKIKSPSTGKAEKSKKSKS